MIDIMLPFLMIYFSVGFVISTLIVTLLIYTINNSDEFKDFPNYSDLVNMTGNFSELIQLWFGFLLVWPIFLVIIIDELINNKENKE